MKSDQKKIVFIVNPISGAKAKLEAIELLKSQLSKNIEYTVIHTERAEHATELTLQAVENKLSAVIAVGGDGTVNEVGKALVNTDVPLGILPFGSGNGFARHRKIPLVMKEAIQCINNFNIKTIDTATLNDEVFLTTAGLGFDAHVGWKFAEDGRRGFITYSQIAINEFMSYKPKDYELVVDGKPLNIKAFVLSIANGGQYGNNAWIAPDASMEDGMLNLSIIEPFPAHFTPDIVFKLFNKSLSASKYFTSHSAKEIIVKKADIYHLDGEPREASGDLIIKVVPKSLRVIC